MSQVNAEAKRGASPWMIGLGIGVVLAIFVWAMYGKASDPNEMPIVKSPGEYEDLRREAERLSLNTLKDVDNGVPAPDSARGSLRRAAVLFDALAAWRPNMISNYTGAGKIYQALGDDRTAIQRFEQGLLVVPKNPVLPIQDTAIETHYLLSVSLLNTKNYADAGKEIDAAIAGYPASPIYLTQRASINIEQHHYDAAGTDLVRALDIDANYNRAKVLLRQLGTTLSNSYTESATQKFNKKNYEGAVADCTAGLRVAFHWPPLLALRSAAYIELGDKKRARADLDVLQAENPDSRDAKTLRARLK